MLRTEKPTVGDRVADACRQAAHVSHEARMLKSVAEDAIEDGVHAAKRAMKSVRRRVEELGDLKDEAAVRVKRQPLVSVGIAAGVGLMVGVALGWMGGRFAQRKYNGD
jgi:ElaB/YqjD/DUF883 family membrane-anchored ribosome-binding protein